MPSSYRWMAEMKNVEKKVVCHVKITSPKAANEVKFLFLLKHVPFTTENIGIFFVLLIFFPPHDRERKKESNILPALRKAETYKHIDLSLLTTTHFSFTEQ